MTLAEHLAKAREHTRRAAELRGKDLDEVQRELLQATDALASAQRLLAGDGSGLRGRKAGGA